MVNQQFADKRVGDSYRRAHPPDSAIYQAWGVNP